MPNPKLISCHSDTINKQFEDDFESTILTFNLSKISEKFKLAKFQLAKKKFPRFFTSFLDGSNIKVLF